MGKKFDPINVWLDNNTGLFGEPLSYQERIDDCIIARGEQMQSRPKRFSYNFYYQQECEGNSSWTYIGNYDVDNQEELWELEKKVSTKYTTNIKYEKVKSRW